MSLSLLLQSSFDRFSGYGNDAVDLAVNLEKHGVDVHLKVEGLMPGLPRSFTRLLEKSPVGPKDALLRFCPPTWAHGWESKTWAPKQVLYTMWERTPILPEDLYEHFRRSEQWGEGRPLNLDEYDRLVVTCPMNVEAFRPVFGGPINVVPCGIEPGDWPEHDRRSGDRPLTFLMVGMLAGRKDPFAFLEPWRRVKQDFPEFDGVLKVHNVAGAGVHPLVGNVYPGVEVTSHSVTREQLVAMYHGADVLVSVSRGEGNNKPAMEMMATGGTVMATDWSGHQNWLFKEATYPLPGRLEKIPETPYAEDFHVDQEAVYETIVHIWRHQDEMRRKQMVAPGLVRAALSWDVLIPKLVREIVS